MKLQIAGTIPESIVDGPGIRYTVFTQGCPHKCKGCHNVHTHDADGGKLASIEEIFESFQKNPMLKGITFSGGEPFSQPEALTQLAQLVHGAGKDVVSFSGFTYEQLEASSDPAVVALLSEVDILIDGLFIEALKNSELQFCGSENQRVIDVKKTNELGAITLWDPS